MAALVATQRSQFFSQSFSNISFYSFLNIGASFEGNLLHMVCTCRGSITQNNFCFTSGCSRVKWINASGLILLKCRCGIQNRGQLAYVLTNLASLVGTRFPRELCTTTWLFVIMDAISSSINLFIRFGKSREFTWQAGHDHTITKSEAKKTDFLRSNAPGNHWRQ